jgi:hypothetical protein
VNMDIRDGQDEEKKKSCLFCGLVFLRYGRIID